MTYRLKTIADGATLFYPMDETSGTTMINYGTGSVNGTYSSPLLNKAPIAARSFRSLNLASGSYSIPLTNLLSLNNDAVSFSVEFWLRPYTAPSGTIGIFAFGSQGVFLSGGKISFRAAVLVNSVGTILNAEYVVPDWNRNYHIVATYTPGQILLYVNGTLVDSVDIPPASPFYGTPTTWGNTGAIDADIEGIAIYYPTLAPSLIEDHYRTGTDYIDLESIFGLDGAQTFVFSDQLANIDHQESFPQDGEWPGLRTDLDVYNGVLTARDNTTGTWQYSIPLDQYGLLDSGRIDWNGSSVAGTITVQISLDNGSTWQTCTNHRMFPNLGAGYDATGKTLLIKFTIVGQATGATPVVMYDAKFTLYEARTQRGWDSKRILTIGGDTDLQPYMIHPQNRSMSFGANFRNTSGWGLINADPDNAVSIAAVEFWIRRDAWTAGNEYIFDMRSVAVPTGPPQIYFDGTTLQITGFSSTYVNGVAASPTAANLPLGKWVHVLCNLTTPTANPVYLNRNYNDTQPRGQNSFGYLTLYSTALSAAQVTARYAAYTGGVRLTIADADQVAISEDTNVDQPEALLLYSHAWSITGGG
jgi:hypothetical protein